MPKKRPTAAESVTPTTTATDRDLGGEEHVDEVGDEDASRTPAMPPTPAITPDSMTNCQRMSRRRAPTDLRTPIS